MGRCEYVVSRSGCTAKHSRTNPRRSTRNGPKCILRLPLSVGLGRSVPPFVTENNKRHIVHPTSLKGCAYLYYGLLYILGFIAPFLVFRYPSSFSRSTATCLSIITRLVPPTDCRLSTLASKSNTSWTSSPKFG